MQDIIKVYYIKYVKGGCRLKKKTAVIVVLAVILICVLVFACSKLLSNSQDTKQDGHVTTSDNADDDIGQLPGDNEEEGTGVSPGESVSQPPMDTEDTQEGGAATDVSSTQDKDAAGSDDGIISPEDAKEMIGTTADLVVRALADKDFDTVSEYVHPDLGVRFTPYTFVSVENDIVFAKGEIKNFLNDKNIYHWGNYDGSGEDIALTPGQYYEKFIYPADFVNAPQVGYNKVLSFGNMQENQFEIYKGAIIVEYYFPGFDPRYEGMDWRSLRLVFQRSDGSWKLTGIINNQWTI
jgi:hypothetical protein